VGIIVIVPLRRTPLTLQQLPNFRRSVRGGLLCNDINNGVRVMMNDGMIWGMGWGYLLCLVLFALLVAALAKYVFFR
jgi:hypothetical protein